VGSVEEWAERPKLRPLKNKVIFLLLLSSSIVFIGLALVIARDFTQATY